MLNKNLTALLGKKEKIILNEETHSKFPILPKELKEENFEILNMLKFKRPYSDIEFGYYLAGLIEGDGSISSNKIEIVFHIWDVSLAYYLKKRIGFGHVYHIKKEQAVKYVISNKEGIIKVLNLINGKFYSDYKIKYMIKHNYEEKYNIKILPPVNYKIIPLDTNSFLAGFSDADSCFNITISKSKTHFLGKNVVLNYRIKQKDKTIINIIKETFKGNIYYFKSEDINCYNSTSFKTIPKFITYFDRYSLISTKFINYIKWRKAFQLILKKEHLTELGLKKIEAIKNSMNTNLFNQK